ncbi:MAG: 6-phosphogluconolactonase [Candidatus Gracilibacteria bacterium]
MKPTIQIIEKEKDFYDQALHWVLENIFDVLAKKEDCRIGLSGGSTPKELYRIMGKSHFPWERITWIEIDERYVPISDKASNAGMIMSELIEESGNPDKKTLSEKFLHFDTSLPYDQSYLAYEQKLLGLKHARSNDEPLFDLMILGAGPDGHIASVFPDSLESMRKGFLTAQTSTDVFDIHDRLTCTMEALTNCHKALLLLKGHEKHDILKKLESGDTVTPVGKFVEKVETTVLYTV